MTVTDPTIQKMPYSILAQTLTNGYIPHNPWPKQIDFLELECLDALYGGAGAGGKSQGLLMAALQFAHVPGYAALIVRRNLTDLELPGGLLDRSHDWLRKVKGAVYNGSKHQWSFREGSILQFGYANREGDEQRYDGSELQFVGMDEACHFTEKQLIFFFERLRRKETIPVPIRYRMGTTPGGIGHEFIKNRYVKPGTPGVVKDGQVVSEGKGFVPATVFDNPSVDAAQYIRSLEEIRVGNPLRYRQMLEGDWDAVAGGRFKREWLTRTWRKERWPADTCSLLDAAGTVVETFNWKTAATFQTYDPSASASTAADHFVLSTWKVTPKANVVWWACLRDQMEIPEQLQAVKSEYRLHRPQFMAVEEVLNQRAHAQFLRQSVNPVIVVRPVNPQGRDKLDRAIGAITLTSSGRLYLPEVTPTTLFPHEDVIGELVRFTGTTKGESDDIVDTYSYAVSVLPTVRVVGSSGSGHAPFIHLSKRSPYDGLR